MVPQRLLPLHFPLGGPLIYSQLIFLEGRPLGLHRCRITLLLPRGTWAVPAGSLPMQGCSVQLILPGILGHPCPTVELSFVVIKYRITHFKHLPTQTEGMEELHAFLKAPEGLAEPRSELEK